MLRLVLLPVMCLALVASTVPSRADDGDDAVALVTLAKLQKGSLDHTIVAYGKVDANPAASHTLMAPLPAVVGEIYVSVGKQVAKDAPLLQLRPSPKTLADYNQAKSALAAAQGELDRTRNMVSQHLATTQQLADAQKALSDARSNFAVLDAQGAAGTQIVRAPGPAIVTAISVKPGAILSDGASLLELAQPDKLVLGVGVTPGEAALIQPGNKATVTPIGEHDQIAGQVESRGSVVDADDGLVNVEITLPAGKFLLGEMAQATIATTKVSGYLVPHEAVLVNDKGKNYVVQAKDLVAKQVVVKVLEEGDGKDVIDGPLDPKSALVLTGNYQLDDGAKMRVADNDDDSAADDKGAAADKATDPKQAAAAADKAADPKDDKATDAKPADQAKGNQPASDKATP